MLPEAEQPNRSTTSDSATHGRGRPTAFLMVPIPSGSPAGHHTEISSAQISSARPAANHGLMKARPQRW